MHVNPQLRFEGFSVWSLNATKAGHDFLHQEMTKESRNSMKWKWLLFVVLALLSEQKFTVPFNDLFWKSQFKQNQKDFPLSILALFSDEKSFVF